MDVPTRGPKSFATIGEGADDLEGGQRLHHGQDQGEPIHVYGILLGRDCAAALFAERHPERVKRLALDAFVWTWQGQPDARRATQETPAVESKQTRRPNQPRIHPQHPHP